MKKKKSNKEQGRFVVWKMRLIFMRNATGKNKKNKALGFPFLFFPHPCAENGRFLFPSVPIAEGLADSSGR
jgi:hypothetical protein